MQKQLTANAMHKKRGFSIIKTVFVFIIQSMDKIHRPFRKFLPADSFRFVFCGGANTLFEAGLFFLFYNFVFAKTNVEFLIITTSPHVAAFLVVFPIVFFTGFLLSRYIVFRESILRSQIQFMRFAITIATSLVLQYLILRLLVEFFHVLPTLSKMITSGIVAAFTYLSHRYFSFKVI